MGSCVNSIEFSDDYDDWPFAGPTFTEWAVDMSWEIDGSKVAPGDTFELYMLCVYKVTSYDDPIELRAGDIVYATCLPVHGEVSLFYSYLKCTIEDTVTPDLLVQGEVEFPVVFNAGGTSGDSDLICAEYFQEGENTIRFTDNSGDLLEATAVFEGGALGPPVDDIVFHNREIPDSRYQAHDLLAGNCENGYKSGTLGMNLRSGGSFICDSVKAAITDQLNDWFIPANASPYPFEVECTETNITVNYGEIPAGYRPFMDSILIPPSGLEQYVMQYVNRYTCADSIDEEDKSLILAWEAYVDYEPPEAEGTKYEYVTSTGDGHRISTLPYDEGALTVTILVEVPIPTVTVTTEYHGDSTSCTLIYTATPGETASVLCYEPIDPEPTPVDPESTPVDPESTPEDPESTPDDPESTPGDPESTPVDPESTPEDPESTPEDPESTPVDPEPTPEDPESTPVDPEPTPEDPESTPVDPEPTPEDPESTPEDPESTPVDPEPTPVDPESTPEDPESTPVDPESTPIDPEPTPVDPESTPVDPESTPVDPESTPADPASTPIEPESTPADHESTPGELESTPGEPESTPGEPESTPGEPESTPVDATTPDEPETTPEITPDEVTTADEPESKPTTSPDEETVESLDSTPRPKSPSSPGSSPSEKSEIDVSTKCVKQCQRLSPVCLCHWKTFLYERTTTATTISVPECTKDGRVKTVTVCENKTCSVTTTWIASTKTVEQPGAVISPKTQPSPAAPTKTDKQPVPVPVHSCPTGKPCSVQPSPAPENPRPAPAPEQPAPQPAPEQPAPVPEQPEVVASQKPEPEETMVLADSGSLGLVSSFVIFFSIVMLL
ncbi:uncharacterized protein J8A68_005983 [[Candida] subhashii]|uniref:Agglutinin-like protein N-terminal domain-containing protein n=1 Tax=[Candida] subhashii TaxID=561895 RepID=A0A8J5QDQ7_9ASCO|nr:uncharacterized protein J8A68_005983 [[Candida] subhashii]KAG7660564.1 hypothetical protein J8A68_005983 [[Candida] subhashii]